MIAASADTCTYRYILELPEEEEREIPTFILLLRLLLVAWICSHSATDRLRLRRGRGIGRTTRPPAGSDNYV